MTTFVKYHHKTTDVALFVSDGKYWIGSYCPRMTHQNDEPLYVRIAGEWGTEAEGLDVLAQMTGDEL